MVTREDRYEIFKALYDEGATGTEIAALLGFSRSYVYEVLNDRDGSRTRARQNSYGGVCVDCGKATSGSNGRAKVPKRCSACNHKRNHENKVWTREAVVEAIRFFAAKYGRPPTATDWNVALARTLGRQDLVDRFRADGCWPHLSSVQGTASSAFRTWNDAMTAAGFTPIEVGKYVRDPNKRYGRPVYWTEERIIAAMQAAYSTNGESPRAYDWDHANGAHPHWVTVRDRFGSWRNGVIAAGFEPRKRGRQVTA